MKALAAFILALAIPLAASAVELEVRYDVDATALKEAIAGTPLTFNIYADSACATLPIATQVVNVEDVGSIEILKRFTPKGAPKPAKTGRIYVTMSPGPGHWRLYYATVTGTGITPVGGACQRQVASASSGITSSVPAGILTITGPAVSLASLAVTIPADGKLLLVFETELNANDSNQQLSCGLSQDSVFFTGFTMDPGDHDVAIPLYDLRQTHTQVIDVTAGDHVYDVSCDLPTGTAVNTYGSRLVAAYFEAGL